MKRLVSVNGIKGKEEEPDFGKQLMESGEKKAKEHYEEACKLWEKGKIADFNNHWVSFTSSVDTIGSNLFSSKQLRGNVIIISSDKAIDISKAVPENLSHEHEVVAPLSKQNVVEILPFKQFIRKYGKGTSYYENKKSAPIIYLF